MCGICGTFGFVDKKLLERMKDAMFYRGPDEEGSYVDSKVMLGHRRLKIIDLSTGRQPIFNEDHDIVIVFNGEIYNFRELKSTLEDLGHTFYTRTDTEVIVHAYEEWGFDAFKKFNGMFAFAIWDSKKKRLILARDRYGIKPLCYAKTKTGVIFASDVKSILAYKEFERCVNKDALRDFLNLRYIPGEQTLFKGIKRVPSASYLLIDDRGERVVNYWTFPFPENEKKEKTPKELVKILEKAVERHMISDVPVGVYLSGGLDSSSIVAFASKITDNPLNTFCMGFGDETDELADAREVADFFGTNHHEFIIESTLLKEFPLLIWYAGTPKRNLYPYYIAKECSKHLKVVLGGVGGDELFAGYSYKYAMIDDFEKKMNKQDTLRLRDNATAGITAQIREGKIKEDSKIDGLNLEKYVGNKEMLYMCINSADKFIEDELGDEFYGNKMKVGGVEKTSEGFKKFFSGSCGMVEGTLAADFRVKMTDDFLFVDDVTSMANSLETRVPFLDNELVDFAFSLTLKQKFSGGVGKIILTEAMRKLVPNRVIKKRKQGFATDTYSVYKKELYEYAKQILPGGRAISEGYINNRYITKILSAGLDSDLVRHYNRIWNILAFEVWYRIFIEGDGTKVTKNMDSF